MSLQASRERGFVSPADAVRASAGQYAAHGSILRMRALNEPGGEWTSGSEASDGSTIEVQMFAGSPRDPQTCSRRHICKLRNHRLSSGREPTRENPLY